MAVSSLWASRVLKQLFKKNAFTSCLETSSCLGSTRSPTIPNPDGHWSASRHYHTSYAQLAGHSKWSNIKHIKAAQDQKKGSMAGMLSRKVQHCLMRDPETDPKLNTELASLIKTARTNNISNDTIQKTIERVVKMRDASNVTAFAGRGPANTGIVIECASLKPHHTKTLLQGVVKKYGFSLHVAGDDLFEHKGKIDVDVPEEDAASAQADPENFNLDKYVDIAIEAGAEDVTLEPGEEGPILQFMCGPQDLTKVHRALDEAGLSVITGERCFIPTTIVPVTADFLEAFSKLGDKLDQFPDVVKYYHNMEPEQAS